MSGFERNRRYVLAFLAATLCSTVVLKLGEIQYLEVIFAADFLLLTVLAIVRGPRWKVFKPFFEIGKSYAIFMIAAFLLSLLALRQEFTGAQNSSFLKQPVIVTLARMGELFLDVFYMLYLASLFREDVKLCRFAAKAYCWAGFVACIYAFVSLPINILYGADLGTYTLIHRFRGFNNEGGGFGLHLLTVGVLMVVLRRLNWMSKGLYVWGMVLIAAGFLGSRSKSGIVALAIFGVFHLFRSYSGVKRWALIGSMAGAVLVLASVINFEALAEIYVRGAQQYQQMSNLRANDANIVMGRISGAVLGPRMLATHPLAGIGWGNYPLVRDDPEYRQGTAFSLSATDAPNLGAVDYLIDLGLPLFFYLTWIEIKPMVMLRRRGADPWVLNLAFMLPLSTWTGVHLNLIHPWIVVAFALGIGYQMEGQAQLSEVSSV